MKKHRWKYDVHGVSPGIGRPHGTVETWTCRACGCIRALGHESTHTGARVIRWHYRDANGYRVDKLPECQG